MSSMTVSQRDLRVMGCRAHLVVHGGDEHLLDLAVDRLRELESYWSRFLPDSDVTRANLAAGSPVVVHEDTLAVVRRAIDGWQQTSGRFDITLLPTLLREGYTHSTVDGALAPEVPGTRSATCASLRLDYAASTLTVGEGGAIDLGGIGKGFAADVIAEELVEAGAQGALVNLGGDIAVQGLPGDDPVWLLGIEDPHRAPEHIATIRMLQGGVATSGTTVRRWARADGTESHHLLDPRLDGPSAAEILTATVVAGDAATAEIYATAVMQMTPPAAITFLDGVGLAGLVVASDGSAYRSSTFEVHAA